MQVSMGTSPSCQVVLAVNEVPSINDITYSEMLDIIAQVTPTL